MLLSNNTYKVIKLLIKYDDLNSIDKLRLAIYLLENKNFSVDFNVRDIIILLKSYKAEDKLNAKNKIK